MASNNLGAPRIADSQTTGQHRTSNDADNYLDGAMTDSYVTVITSTNALTLSAYYLTNYFRFVITAATSAPTAAVTITIDSGTKRGLTFWQNTLSYPATVKVNAQAAPFVVIPPGGYALAECDGTTLRLVNYLQPFFHTVAASDEATTLTSGTNKVTFRMPCRAWITEVRASVNTAQSGGSLLTVDINEAGTSILSTKLTIDNSEKTSTTAATAPVISDPALADDAEITVDIDTVGSGTPNGLKVTLIGFRY